tara:strand:- start:4758 stop:4973 length:216 start_codon:yes stop_codon:yes gene_type:complete
MTNEDITHWHCPRCAAELETVGCILMGGERLPVFQCDDCVVSRDFAGEAFDVNYTFTVDRHGRAFDPAEDA